MIGGGSEEDWRSVGGVLEEGVGLDEDCRRVGGGLGEEWMRVGGVLEED